MRILWVKIGGLWPPNTGGRLRSFHLVAELARRHRLTLITTHAPGDDPGVLRTQLPQCERILSLPFAIPKWSSARFPGILLRSWFSSLPVDLWKCQVPAMRAEVKRLMETGEIDVCIADFLVATPNVPLRTGVPVVFFAHNVEHMIWKRLHDTSSRSWQRALLDIEWRKMRRSEATVCRQADLTVAVSPQDRALLASLAPDAEIRSVATGVDVNYYTPVDQPEKADHLVFLGSMDWHPNEDAVLHFIDAILPRIRSQRPRAVLTVVGRNPSERLRRAAARAGVRVTGTVDDVRPFVADAAVLVVPLRVGGGTRLKIFEALAMGKAVVSTRIGAEGLPIINGVHYLCADEPGPFSDAVVELLEDAPRRRRLGQAGRHLVENAYAWTRVAKEFEGWIEGMQEQPRTAARRAPRPEATPEPRVSASMHE